MAVRRQGRGGAGGSGRAPEPSPEEIEAELRAQRQSLAESIDELMSRISPREQARQAGDDLREQAETRLTALRHRTGSGVAELRRQGREAEERARRGLGRAQELGSRRLKETGSRLRGLLSTPR
ncbi:DUF3618 domain-containing protein [Actinomyces bowdenii]|uniref:DUF3618 domain-containing protein n=1 Tax=Actinomyces bowdenii TaxID=131109 RepID=A0A853EHZ3_9ACTO|nr:DUF3618 domain-containing protein [Actinomyces bowdenii]MBF0696601.1 DUF3618 domain-containing protein [Actinomyces bowdenii]NYS68774.1 DUF3618 domain-containing protein [Actinomyces bowdenii]